MKTSAKTIVWSVILIILGYFLVRFIMIGPKAVPEQFKTAREKGAVLASDISTLSSGSIEKLNEVSKLDAEYDFIDSMVVIEKELIRNNQLKDKAVELSNELARMAESLPGIQPRRARELVTEAIGYEVALVSRLISWSDTFKGLFDVLKSKYEGQTFATNKEINKLIDELNSQAGTINTFNKAFESTLVKFDEVYK